MSTFPFATFVQKTFHYKTRPYMLRRGYCCWGHREPIHSWIFMPAKSSGKLGVVMLCKDASNWIIMERYRYELFPVQEKKSILCNFIHLSGKYLLLFVILRAKRGISKIAELQFYFSAELRVATTNFQKVTKSVGDHGVFAFLIVQLRLSFKWKPTFEVQPYPENTYTWLK